VSTKTVTRKGMKERYNASVNEYMHGGGPGVKRKDFRVCITFYARFVLSVAKPAS
jgi:hypothetical protein